MVRGFEIDVYLFLLFTYAVIDMRERERERERERWLYYRSVSLLHIGMLDQ